MYSGFANMDCDFLDRIAAPTCLQADMAWLICLVAADEAMQKPARPPACLWNKSQRGLHLTNIRGRVHQSIYIYFFTYLYHQDLSRPSVDFTAAFPSD